ncbi:MAG: GTPase [Ketobacteraceae bacterium]|nr:GTPase [Ketobacteraceae bacterium]
MNESDESGKGWKKLREILIEPKVDEEALNQALETASARQAPPVLWLLGKTQSGKTSLIRALTGSSDAEIGNGFRPCTKTARFYDFPAEAPVVRFLDTRGLGEVDYDPGNDIDYCESQAHLVIAVMKASDVRQDAVFDVLRAIRKRHPGWAVLVVQTCLHELYPPDGDHPSPYPFDQENWSRQVPADLGRALLDQRERLGKLAGDGPLLWVPVDFTLPEDGYQPVYYGLDALWTAIETVSSFGLQTLLREDPDVKSAYSRAAHPHIMGYTLAAATVGALPVVDMALVPALQVKLLHTLAALYKLSWNARTSSEFFGLLGVSFAAGYGLRWAGRGLIKLIPVWGQTVGAVWGATTSGAITFALGKSACFYLEQKGKGITVDAEALRKVYADALSRGRRLSPLQEQAAESSRADTDKDQTS